jgi:hypothetical protein
LNLFKVNRHRADTLKRQEEPETFSVLPKASEKGKAMFSFLKTQMKINASLARASISGAACTLALAGCSYSQKSRNAKAVDLQISFQEGPQSALLQDGSELPKVLIPLHIGFLAESDSGFRLKKTLLAEGESLELPTGGVRFKVAVLAAYVDVSLAWACGNEERKKYEETLRSKGIYYKDAWKFVYSETTSAQNIDAATEALNLSLPELKPTQMGNAYVKTDNLSSEYLGYAFLGPLSDEPMRDPCPAREAEPNSIPHISKPYIYDSFKPGGVSEFEKYPIFPGMLDASVALVRTNDTFERIVGIPLRADSVTFTVVDAISKKVVSPDAASLDFDGDGIANNNELASFLDPSSDSRPVVITAITSGDGRPRFSLESRPGIYRLSCSVIRKGETYSPQTSPRFGCGGTFDVPMEMGAGDYALIVVGEQNRGFRTLPARVEFIIPQSAPNTTVGTTEPNSPTGTPPPETKNETIAARVANIAFSKQTYAMGEEIAFLTEFVASAPKTPSRLILNLRKQDGNFYDISSNILQTSITTAPSGNRAIQHSIGVPDKTMPDGYYSLRVCIAFSDNTQSDCQERPFVVKGNNPVGKPAIALSIPKQGYIPSEVPVIKVSSDVKLSEFSWRIHSPGMQPGSIQSSNFQIVTVPVDSWDYVNDRYYFDLPMPTSLYPLPAVIGSFKFELANAKVLTSGEEYWIYSRIQFAVEGLGQPNLVPGPLASYGIGHANMHLPSDNSPMVLKLPDLRNTFGDNRGSHALGLNLNMMNVGEKTASHAFAIFVDGVLNYSSPTSQIFPRSQNWYMIEIFVNPSPGIHTVKIVVDYSSMYPGPGPVQESIETDNEVSFQIQYDGL